MSDDLRIVKMIDTCRAQVVSTNKSYIQIERELKEQGVDPRTVAAVIRNTKELIANSEFEEQFTYYTTYLAKVKDIYENLKLAGEYTEALKALQEHKKTYFLLKSLLE